MEHITLNVEPRPPHRLLSIYYSSHGYMDGVRIDVDPSAAAGARATTDCCPQWRVEYERHPLYPADPPHVVVFAANGGHGVYPNAGCVPRFLGLATEHMSHGYRWLPQVVRVRKRWEADFAPEKDGWLYWPGQLGVDGIRAPALQSWFFREVPNYKGRTNLNRFCGGYEVVEECCPKRCVKCCKGQ